MIFIINKKKTHYLLKTRINFLLKNIIKLNWKIEQFYINKILILGYANFTEVISANLKYEFMINVEHPLEQIPMDV